VLYPIVMLPMTLGDKSLPKTTSISVFCIAFPIFIVDECRDLKFGRQVDHSKSQPMDNKASVKGCGHITLPVLNF